VLRLAAPFSLQGRVIAETAKDGAEVKPPAVFLIPHAGRVMREYGAFSWMLDADVNARPGFRSVLYEGDGGNRADAVENGTFVLTSVYAGS
jgi:hypothetical protein